MLIKCIYIPKKLTPFQRLTVGERYLLVGLEYGGHRIVNEDGEPALYPKRWFEKIDQYPSHWKKSEYDDGQYFIYPPELEERYFFERWFDKDPVILETFNKFVKSVTES